MPKQHRMAAATLVDLYFGCAMLLVPDAPIPHQLLAGAVRALHGRGDTLTVSELEQARDWLLARRQLRAGPGSDRSFVLIDRKTARQAPTSGEFLAAARQALEHSLLHMVAREPASGQIPDRIWPQIDRVLQWSRARSDAATAALCTFSASHALAQRHFARAVDLLRYALAIDPDPADTIGRRAILAEALLRLGMPDEALSVMEQMAEPPATLPATRQWAAHVAAARASAITPLPWSCVPDDLVYLLGGTLAFRDAYERSLRLACPWYQFLSASDTICYQCGADRLCYQVIRDRSTCSWQSRGGAGCQVAREIGDRHGEAMGCLNLGEMQARQGNSEEAIRLMQPGSSPYFLA